MANRSIIFKMVEYVSDLSDTNLKIQKTELVCT